MIFVPTGVYYRIQGQQNIGLNDPEPCIKQNDCFFHSTEMI